MLTLTRKVGERIHIGENIVIYVVEIDRNQVRIGIEAPKHIPVNRHEVHAAKVAGRDRNGNGDPLPGSPWAARIAEAKRAWIEQTRITRRLQKGNKR